MRLKSLSFGDRYTQHFAFFLGFYTTTNTPDQGVCYNTGNFGDSYINLVPQNLTTVLCGFFLNPQNIATKNIFSFAHDSQTVGDLWYNFTTNRYEIRVNGVTHGATGVYGPSTPVHVEMKHVLGSSGTFELKINHTAETITFNGNTVIGGATKINRLYFRGSDAGNLIDSVWINDASGTFNNGYDGVVHMADIPFIADDVDDNEYAKLGSVNGFENIDESPANLADYNYADLLSLKQAYVPGPHAITAPGVIIAYLHRHLVDKVSSGALIPYVKLGTNRSFSTAQQIGVSPTPIEDRRILHPSGANWALTDTPHFGLQSSF